MNLPNTLTLLRLVLTAFFVASFSWSFPGHHTVALLFFLAASLTDYLDGEIARRCNLITDFGRLMDPLADKILMASAFICLLAVDLLPAWVVIVIISREFLITGLRLLASSKGTILPAEKLGKHKTLWQIITVIYFFGLLSAKEWVAIPGQDYWRLGGQLLVAVTVLLTIYSGGGYLWKHRGLLADR